VVQPILVVDLPQQFFDSAGTLRIGEQLAWRPAAKLYARPVEPLCRSVGTAQHARSEFEEIGRIVSMHREVLC
jgi:hypothetical protein